MLKFLKMLAPSLYSKQKHLSGLISLVSFCMDEAESGLKHGLLHAYVKYLMYFAVLVLLFIQF